MCVIKSAARKPTGLSVGMSTAISEENAASTEECAATTTILVQTMDSLNKNAERLNKKQRKSYKGNSIF